MGQQVAARFQRSSGLGRQPILCDLVSSLSLTFTDSGYEHHNLLIKHLIDQAISSTFELHFVAILQLAKSIGFYSRTFQYLHELLFELLANRIAQFVPLL
jgi:hypothetical protein